MIKQRCEIQFANEKVKKALEKLKDPILKNIFLIQTNSSHLPIIFKAFFI